MWCTIAFLPQPGFHIMGEQEFSAAQGCKERTKRSEVNLLTI